MHRYRPCLQSWKLRRISYLYQCRLSSSLAEENSQSSRQQSSITSDNNSTLKPSSSIETWQGSDNYATNNSFFPANKSTPGYKTTRAPQNRGTSIHDWHEKHPDLYDKIPDHVETEFLNKLPCKLLLGLLRDYLPQDPDTHEFGFNQKYFLPFGWHLVQVLYPIQPEHLLFDGTDKRFTPGPPHAWPYRLWLGGSISLNAPRTLGVGTSWLHMVESVEKVHVSDHKLDRAVVHVAKRFARASFGDHQKRPGRWARTKRSMRQSYDPKSESDERDIGSDLVETYDLLFLRNRPVFPKPTQSSVAISSSEAPYKHTLIPTKALLFGWSALILNAHRIHLDGEFAQKEYGARSMLVQGTLTLILALEYLRRILATYGSRRPRNRPTMRTVSYKNLRPLYVDEPMTICLTPAGSKNDECPSKWQIQIIAGREGAQYLAFSARVTVDPPQAQGNDDQPSFYEATTEPRQET